jgi:hypothetical protein
MSDLAQGNVQSAGGGFVLRRNGKTYEIGPMPESLQGQDAFQNVLQQVVSMEVSLKGEPIAPAHGTWIIGPEEAVKAVEKHPLARMAMNSPHWGAWQDVIRGLALEHGGS